MSDREVQAKGYHVVAGDLETMNPGTGALRRTIAARPSVSRGLLEQRRSRFTGSSRRRRIRC